MGKEFFVNKARQDKVEKMIQTIKGLWGPVGWTKRGAFMFAQWPKARRLKLAEVAGVNPPSQKTWIMLCRQISKEAT